MLKISLKTKREGIAAITIVLLLGFLSLLSTTSIFAFNSWRWETLNNSIKKENQSQAVNSASLYTYILLARQRNNTSGNWSIFDTYENLVAVLPTNISVGSLGILTDCNIVATSPSAYNSNAIKKITVSNLKDNMLVNQTCCTAGLYKGEFEDEIQTEGLIYQYSRQRCKNFNWPNLKDSATPLMGASISQ